MEKKRAILTFHSIDNANSVLSYAPDLFEKLLNSLIESNIPIVDLCTLLQQPDHAGVAITFDDGMKSVLTNAAPILKNLGASAHLFLCTSAVDSNAMWPAKNRNTQYKMLNWKEIETLQSQNFHIGSHTHNHHDSRSLTADDFEKDCHKADQILFDKIGVQPKYFAFPFGYHHAISRAVVRQRYDAAMSTELGLLTRNNDLAVLPRLDSYYLKSAYMISNWSSSSGRWYLKARSQLRTLRGTQVPAS